MVVVRRMMVVIRQLMVVIRHRHDKVMKRAEAGAAGP
jgi:hypothetical protein